MARVLVVDDCRTNRDLMSYLLRALGHEVRCAADGAAGLQAARRERPDLIVIDIEMPVMDGFGLLAAVKADAALANVPTAGVTCTAVIGQRGLLSAGFDGSFSTPIDLETFAAEVEDMLRLGNDPVLG